MTTVTVTGILRKMRVEATDPVTYWIPVGDSFFAISECIGQPISLHYTGRILCTACGRPTKKSFAQGYCFPCFRSLAECDLCIMKPETCHYYVGTCRDPAWGENYCMKSHIVYLANSSSIKVGITRANQIPTRWIDQGASQAISVFRVKKRLHSGLLEVALKKQVSDRTDWRKMLKGKPEIIDMTALRNTIRNNAQSELTAIQKMYPELEWESLDDAPVNLEYPVNRFPEKVSSLSFANSPDISGILTGIKGQYLILDSGVINIRKFAGYEVTIS